MKNRIWLYLLLLLSLSACKGIKTVHSDMEEEQLGCENEMAKAILWIDRTGNESLKQYGFIRTAKAHVNVYSDGTFRIMSFCKKQEPEVVEYLKKRVAVFTAPNSFSTKATSSRENNTCSSATSRPKSTRNNRQAEKSGKQPYFSAFFITFAQKGKRL